MVKNIFPFTDPKVIESEALTWLVRMDRDEPLSDQELSELKKWIQQSTRHRDELLRLSKFWKSADVLMELAIPLHHRKNQLTRHAAPGGLKVRKALQFGVAAFVLFCATYVGMYFYHSAGITKNGIYVTAIGEQEIRILPDGSRILLNTDSQIQVDYSEKLRRIRMLRGEAFFDVEKDPSRPFAVYAGDSEVLAVGTSFSVRLIQDQVKVMVSEGVVNLSVAQPVAQTANVIDQAFENTDMPLASKPATKTVFKKLESLEAGHGATFSSAIEELVEFDEDQLKRNLSWREGMLTFSGDSLEQVVKEINRYTPISIDIVDPELRTLSIGGRFPVGNIEALFEVLEMGFGVKVNRLDDQHIQLAVNTAQHPGKG